MLSTEHSTDTRIDTFEVIFFPLEGRIFPSTSCIADLRWFLRGFSRGLFFSDEGSLSLRQNGLNSS